MSLIADLTTLLGATNVLTGPDMARYAQDWMGNYHGTPLAVARQIWEQGGIGPARLAVMDRVTGPKTAILGRTGDRAAGIAFTAIHNNVAMLHALETAPDQRRKGCAHNILRAAAIWARDNGADTLALLVTERNTAARALYAACGFAVVRDDGATLELAWG